MSKRTVAETIAYFRELEHRLEVQAHRSADLDEKMRLRAKADAYHVAAFELERNTEH